VSRQIVEQHGGRIWVERNGGTSFCFSLPTA
jgi:signal transduction histidine kinase